MSRARQQDRRSAGRSKLVPYRPDEAPGERHARRLQANLEQGQTDVQAWGEQHGVILAVKNHGHHWIFTKGNWTAEWWPSSAKLVIQRAYHRGIHVHDWKQAIRELERALAREEKR